MNSFNSPRSFSEKKQAIARIASLNLNQIDTTEFKKLLDIIFSGYFFQASIVDYGWILYRGIKYSQKPRMYHHLIYPPKDKAKINRASEEGQQMFYCSTNKKAVFYELGAMPGDTLVISTWVTSPNLLLSNIGFTESNLRALGATDSSPMFKRSLIVDDSEENQYIHNYLSSAFSQPIIDSSTYKLTIAIANFFLNEISGNEFINNASFDGLLYPTIRFQANANNIVFKPNVVDQKRIIFEKVEFVEVKGFENNKYEYKILDIADDLEDASLLWKGLDQSWTVNDENNELYFVDGNAYDASGEIIPPD